MFVDYDVEGSDFRAHRQARRRGPGHLHLEVQVSSRVFLCAGPSTVAGSKPSCHREWDCVRYVNYSEWRSVRILLTANCTNHDEHGQLRNRLPIVVCFLRVLDQR